MKILIAVHHFPPHYNGGAEWVAYHMAASLQARGHSIRVVCIENIDQGPSNGVAWVDEQYDGISVRRLSFNLAQAPDPLRWEYDNPWIGQHFDRLLDEYQPDIFHLISGYLMTGRPVWIAHEHGIPCLVSLEDFWFLCPRITMLRSDGTLSTLPIDPYTCAQCLSGEKRRFKVLNRTLPGIMNSYWHLQKTRAHSIQDRLDFLTETLQKMDRLIVRSDFLRSSYQAAGAPSEKMVFSRQGLDFPSLPSQPDRRSAGQPLRVGYLGQITWHKGVHVLLEAVRSIPEANLEVKVYGNSDRFPSYTARLEGIIAGDPRLSLAGSFNGYAEEGRVLRDLDVVVVPSLWYENSPNVILESFSQHVPVLASNLGGMAEMVHHDQNGLVFKVGDPQDLARQLLRLCEDPTLLPRLRAGISPVKTVAEEVDELESVYQELVHEGKALVVDPVGPGAH